jgi:hypothetical protein
MQSFIPATNNTAIISILYICSLFHVFRQFFPPALFAEALFALLTVIGCSSLVSQMNKTDCGEAPPPQSARPRDSVELVKHLKNFPTVAEFGVLLLFDISETHLNVITLSDIPLLVLVRFFVLVSAIEVMKSHPLYDTTLENK